MGDISHGSTASLGPADPSQSQVTDVVGGSPLQGKQPTPEHDLSQHYQYSISSQHAFATQFDMAQSSPVPRQGPYNMGSMANSLPQMGYQRPSQYGHGGQRHNPMSSPSMLAQMPQMQGFGGHPSMHTANQGYYVQQPQMPPYYGAGQLSPTQAASQRQNMTYYPSQMMMNPPQSAYYYPPTPQYPTQTPTMPTAMMAGHFVPANHTGSDSYTLNHSPESNGTPFQGQGQKPSAGMFTLYPIQLPI